MTERKTVVYPNPQVLAEAVAARTLLTIIDLLAEPNRKRVDIAVTGGTDGNRVFAAMNASPLNDAVDWSRAHVWWGDERFVAADDDDRNAKQAREAWYGALVESGRISRQRIMESWLRITNLYASRAAAARAATEAGFTQVFNVLEGFEGDLDGQRQRGDTGGWRHWGLPWVQD